MKQIAIIVKYYQKSHMLFEQYRYRSSAAYFNPLRMMGNNRGFAGRVR